MDGVVVQHVVVTVDARCIVLHVSDNVVSFPSFAKRDDASVTRVINVTRIVDERRM